MSSSFFKSGSKVMIQYLCLTKHTIRDTFPIDNFAGGLLCASIERAPRQRVKRQEKPQKQRRESGCSPLWRKKNLHERRGKGWLRQTFTCSPRTVSQSNIRATIPFRSLFLFPHFPRKPGSNLVHVLLTPVNYCDRKRSEKYPSSLIERARNES